MLRFRTFVSSEPERSSSLLQFSISYPESKVWQAPATKYFYCTYIENYSVNLSPDQPAWVENFTLPQIFAVSFETLAVGILPLKYQFQSLNRWNYFRWLFIFVKKVLKRIDAKRAGFWAKLLKMWSLWTFRIWAFLSLCWPVHTGEKLKNHIRMDGG